MWPGPKMPWISAKEFRLECSGHLRSWLIKSTPVFRDRPYEQNLEGTKQAVIPGS